MPARRYSDDLRRRAVDEVVEGERTVAEVARELGVGGQSLRNWVAEDRAARHSGNGPATTREHDSDMTGTSSEAPPAGPRPVLLADQGKWWLVNLAGSAVFGVAVEVVDADGGSRAVEGLGAERFDRGAQLGAHPPPRAKAGSVVRVRWQAEPRGSILVERYELTAAGPVRQG